MSEVPLCTCRPRPVVGFEKEALSSLQFYSRYRGTSLIKNSPPPKDHHMALDICYCRFQGGGCFVLSEVPL